MITNEKYLVRSNDAFRQKLNWGLSIKWFLGVDFQGRVTGGVFNIWVLRSIIAAV